MGGHWTLDNLIKTFTIVSFDCNPDSRLTWRVLAISARCPLSTVQLVHTVPIRRLILLIPLTPRETRTRHMLYQLRREITEKKRKINVKSHCNDAFKRDK